MKIKTKLRGGPSEIARVQHMKIKTKLRGGPSEICRRPERVATV